MSYVIKPEFIRPLGSIDISPIKNVISRTTDRVWNLENEQKENKFDCFHDTRHIVFRFIEGMRDHRRFYSNPNWHVWQSRLQPMMSRAIAPYGIRQPEFPKVMLARLAAGSAIDRHVDGAGSNLYTHKIHIPIQSNPGAKIIINDQAFHLEEGEAYEVNNLAPHSVENRGDADRIHLIFEVFDIAEQQAAA